MCFRVTSSNAAAASVPSISVIALTGRLIGKGDRHQLEAKFLKDS